MPGQQPHSVCVGCGGFCMYLIVETRACDFPLIVCVCVCLRCASYKHVIRAVYIALKVGSKNARTQAIRDMHIIFDLKCSEYARLIHTAALCFMVVVVVIVVAAEQVL